MSVRGGRAPQRRPVNGRSMAVLGSQDIDHATLVPSRLDHDLALRLCDSAELDDHERVICTLIALAAAVDEPVLPETLVTFRQILQRTAAS